MDYGAIYEDTMLGNGEEKDIVEHFIEQYNQYAGENKEIYFILGNIDEMWLLTYEEIT